jgi:hypothetical protein
MLIRVFAENVALTALVCATARVGTSEQNTTANWPIRPVIKEVNQDE